MANKLRMKQLHKLRELDLFKRNPDSPPHIESHNGNSDLNFSQEIHDVHRTFELTNESYIMTSSSADPSTVTKVTPQKKIRATLVRR
jgi:hypothetical protein